MIEYSHVSLRDYASYCLVKELVNVQYAPDVVFQIGKPAVEQTNNVVISLIKIENKTDNEKIVNAYYSLLKAAAEHFAEKGFNVTLCAFCKSEGDEEAVNELLSMISDKTCMVRYNKLRKFRIRPAGG